MKRRELLAGMAALGVAGPVHARPPMPLHDKPRQMLSPPFVNGKLNIGATWCVPCREEMPTLDALQEKLGGDDFHVLPLSIDRAGMEIVRRFYDEIGIRHLDTYLAEDIRVMAAFAVVGLPTTILIDRDGFERGRLVGPAEWDSPAVMAQIQTIINERSE